MILKTLEFLDPLWLGLVLVILAGLSSCTPPPEEPAPAPRLLVLKNGLSQVALDRWGGGIVDIHFLDHPVNPLSWRATEDIEPLNSDGPNLQGHFVCFDRWGAPSPAEEKMGMPYHGEAPRVVWERLDPSADEPAGHGLRMGCTLPLAGMEVKRTVRLQEKEASLTVTEEVTNIRAAGRVYNLVQHPSIAPPFLDDTTIVDCNASHGLVQEEPVPESVEDADRWPRISIGGTPANLRFFRGTEDGASGHDVTAFIFDPGVEYGWVTAATPSAGLLVGYLWKISEYPWLNMWRYRHQGKVSARGLEFGTTGIHQPFPTLLQLGKVLDRGVYEYLDAGETDTRSYILFLARIPGDFQGVESAEYDGAELHIRERRDDQPRSLTVEVGSLP